MASCHQFISEDPANCGFSLLCFYAVKLHFLSVDACSPQSPYRGTAQNPRVLFTHYWFWAAFPPAAICTYFFPIPQLFSPVHAQFLPFPGNTLGMCILHSSIFTQHCPHNTDSHCTVHVGVPTTHKVFTTVSFLLDHPFPVPGPSSHFQCQEQPINPHMYCNGTISSKDFTTRCYTSTECNSYMQMSPTMTIHHFLVIPSSKSKTADQIGAQNHSRTTLRTRSPLQSPHNSTCTPLARLLGAHRVDPRGDRL